MCIVVGGRLLGKGLSMKLVLLEDVKKLGKKGDLVEVSDGYAVNFLLPRKLAKAATKGVVKALQKEQKDKVAKKEREREEAQALADRLEGGVLKVAVKAGEGGKLFGSVTTQDVARAVKEQLGAEIDKRKVVLDKHIKTLGKHSAMIKLHPKVSAKVVLEVVAEEARG